MKRMNSITDLLGELYSFDQGQPNTKAEDKMWNSVLMIEGKWPPSVIMDELKKSKMDLNEAVWAPLWEGEEHGDIVVFPNSKSVSLIKEAIKSRESE